MSPFLRLASSPRIVRNSIRIALVVGTIINLINQGPRVWSGGEFSWIHGLLNYCVPYCVATYSAVRNQLSRP
jgi:hypothetical protein